MAEETTTLDQALAGADTPQEPVEQAQPAEPVEAKPEDGPKGGVDAETGNVTVPLAALHAERDKVRDLKREFDDLKTSLTQPAQVQPEPDEMPDPLEDPQAFRDWQSRTLQGLSQGFEQRLINERANTSESFAVRQHGQAKVDAVKEWVKTQPDSVKSDIVSQADPYEYAIQQQQRQTLTEQLTSDPAKLERVLQLLEGKQEPAKAPPASTVSQQSVGGRTVPQWNGPTPLEAIFGD